MKILILTLLIALSSFSDVILDRVIAVVNDDVILESEINEILFMSAKGQGQTLPEGEALIKLKSQIIKNVINDKILLIAAEKESLTVNSEDIITQRNMQIEGYIKQVGSKEALEQELIKSGTASSLPEFKKKLYENLMEASLKQMLVGKYEHSIELTKNEVSDFFDIYKDSLPPEKNSIHLGHIMKDIIAGEELVKSKMHKVKKILDSLSSGANYDTLAKYMSEDPLTSKFSGDLGYFRKGDLDLDPKFEDAAFKLSPGSISGPIRTKNSLILIKCIDKREDEVRVKIIVLFLQPSEEDLIKVKEEMVKVSKGIKTIDDFKKAAAKISSDKLSGSKGGDLGWLPIQSLDKDYLTAVEKLEPGIVSEPVLVQSGSKQAFHLFMIFEKKDERYYSLANDLPRIKQMARSWKLQKKLEDLYKKYEKKVYIENRQEHNIYR